MHHAEPVAAPYQPAAAAAAAQQPAAAAQQPVVEEAAQEVGEEEQPGSPHSIADSYAESDATANKVYSLSQAGGGPAPGRGTLGRGSVAAYAGPRTQHALRQLAHLQLPIAQLQLSTCPASLSGECSVVNTPLPPSLPAVSLVTSLSLPSQSLAAAPPPQEGSIDALSDSETCLTDDLMAQGEPDHQPGSYAASKTDSEEGSQEGGERGRGRGKG